MTLYPDTNLPVPSATDAIHADELLSFARPGTWGTAAQRRAIAAEARQARCEAGVQESVGDEDIAGSADLPAAARRLAREVALGGIGIDRRFYEQTLQEGVTEGAYVEIVGVVARLAQLDVFARGLGIPSRELPEAVEDASPSMERPGEAMQLGFFTAAIPDAPQGGALAVELWGDQPGPNIFRSLTLVPQEARRLVKVMSHQYFNLETMMNLDYSSLKGIDRPQLELVAAKVSALNQCFY